MSKTKERHPLAKKLKEKSDDFHAYVNKYFDGMKDATPEELIARTEEVTIMLLSTVYNASYLLHALSSDRIEMREELEQLVDLGISDAYGFYKDDPCIQ